MIGDATYCQTRVPHQCIYFNGAIYVLAVKLIENRKYYSLTLVFPK